jgi:hypothetical protein
MTFPSRQVDDAESATDVLCFNGIDDGPVTARLTQQMSLANRDKLAEVTSKTPALTQCNNGIVRQQSRLALIHPP